MEKVTNAISEAIFYPEDSIVELHFFSPADGLEITGEDYKSALGMFLDFCKKHKPYRVLINTIEGSVLLPPDIQAWMRREIYPELAEAGISTKAYLVSEEAFVTKISMRQTAEGQTQEKASPFVFQFFTDYNTAYQWLRVH